MHFIYFLIRYVYIRVRHMVDTHTRADIIRRCSRAESWWARIVYVELAASLPLSAAEHAALVLAAVVTPAAAAMAGVVRSHVPCIYIYIYIPFPV